MRSINFFFKVSVQGFSAIVPTHLAYYHVHPPASLSAGARIAPSRQLSSQLLFAFLGSFSSEFSSSLTLASVKVYSS